MHKKNNQLIFSPTDLVNFMKSPYTTWLDRYHLEFPGAIYPDEPDESLKIAQKKGIEHELAFLTYLRDQNKDVTEVSGKASTHQALNAGREIVYQPELYLYDESSGFQFRGFADFLFKVKGISKLGDWHYEPWDTKLALNPRPYFIIQLCMYAEMLESIQGVLPKYIHVFLGSNEQRSFRVTDYFYFYRRLKAAFIKQQQSFDSNYPPEINGLDDYGRWSTHVQKKIEQENHVSLVANITRIQIKKLKKHGIHTVKQLAQSDIVHIAKMDDNTLITLKKQALIQLESFGRNTPAYKVIIHENDSSRRGLSALPPASTLDVWFDMEGYPYAKGGLEYLFGVSYIDSTGALMFKDWWAHNSYQEKLAFQGFVDWVHERWKRDPAMHIYHYAAYEVTALKRLMQFHGSCEDKIDDLLRNNVFIDLYVIVREGLCVGEPRYSLKNIEHLYSKSRGTDVAKATDSIVYYERWLTTQDGNDWQTSAILNEIRDYNKDDCESTKALCDWLRKVQNEEAIEYRLKREPKEQESFEEVKISPKKELRLKIATLIQEIEAKIASDDYVNEDAKKLACLLRHILQFHHREERPVWWAHYDRIAMTPEQLAEDNATLAGLERTQTLIEPIKRSNLYEYAFNAGQDTKLKKGDTCYYIAADCPASDKIVIDELDIENGLVKIKIGQGKILPDMLSLIPDEYISADTIVAAIYEQAVVWHNGGNLSSAIEDFLLQHKPRIKGHLSGNIIVGQSIEEIIRAINEMENTTLCIQGPPGAGKTYTAARAIVALMQSGKTVGITSNGHKAIAHLIDAVMQAADRSGVFVRATKIQSDPEQFHVVHSAVEKSKKASDVFTNDYHSLIGGTAWVFSNSVVKGKLDYLFVDEAGQVSIANLVGMAASTKNIVLMGDQMQLSQPTKGVHPENSGKSCLDYFLQGQQTIAGDQGIFLEKTYRLHPNICQFISEAFYEGRLQADCSVRNRQIILPNQNTILTKDSGIVFVPVEHEDNEQSSIEEVEKIKELVSLLLKSTFENSAEDNDAGSKQRAITLDDILVVAPYNMQVRKIQEAIPAIKVASVDKFQGQEAPIVILSMTASDIKNAARGLDFILNKNRINVALTRAQVLAIVVGNPNLANISCNTIEQMELANLFCKIVDTQNL